MLKIYPSRTANLQQNNLEPAIVNNWSVLFGNFFAFGPFPVLFHFERFLLVAFSIYAFVTDWMWTNTLFGVCIILLFQMFYGTAFLLSGIVSITWGYLIYKYYPYLSLKLLGSTSPSFARVGIVLAIIAFFLSIRRFSFLGVKIQALTSEAFLSSLYALIHYPKLCYIKTYRTLHRLFAKNTVKEKTRARPNNSGFDNRIEMKEALDPYTVLNLPRTFSDSDLKKAFHRQISMYHPDKVAHLGPDIQRFAENRTKELNKAFKLLSSQRF